MAENSQRVDPRTLVPQRAKLAERAFEVVQRARSREILGEDARKELHLPEKRRIELALGVRTQNQCTDLASLDSSVSGA